MKTANQENAAAHAQDEDTAVGDSVVECGWVIYSAAKYIDYRFPIWYGEDGKPNGAEENEKLRTFDHHADAAAKCRAFLKGLRHGLAVDSSEQYVNHLIEVADSIERCRIGKYNGNRPLTCFSPDQITTYGGVKKAGGCGVPMCLDKAIGGEKRKVFRDAHGRKVATATVCGGKTVYRDAQGRRIASMVEDDAYAALADKCRKDEEFKRRVAVAKDADARKDD